MAVGSDDRAAYTAGVPVAAVRFLAYVLAGLFAAVGGLSLTGLIGSADPNVAANLTLLAISAVALGGVSLAGGSGGLAAAALGAVAIFLLQAALTYFNVSTFLLQIAYGLVLTLAVVLNSTRLRRRRRCLASRLLRPAWRRSSVALLVHLAGMLLIQGFGTTFGVRAMLVLASLLAIASIGQTLAIMLGGIDLSIPFVIGFANVAAAQLYGQGVPFALVLPGRDPGRHGGGRAQRRPVLACSRSTR